MFLTPRHIQSKKAVVLLSLLGGMIVGRAESPPTERAVLKTIADIRRLPRHEVDQGLAARIQGVITLRLPEGGTIVDDGKDAILCKVGEASKRKLLRKVHDPGERASVGAFVEVEGETVQGDYAPALLPKKIHVLGPGVLPEAVASTVSELHAAVYASRRVSLTGVVRFAEIEKSTHFLRLIVGSASGSFRLRLLTAGEWEASRLVDARVRVTGCALPVLNTLQELVGISIQSNLSGDLKILEPAPADPFTRPATELARLRSFSPEGPALHRQKVRGVVTWHRPNEYLFIQRGTRGIQIFSDTPEPLRPGDIVEAVGFADLQSAVARLENAWVRKVANGSVPEPQPVTMERLLRGRDDWRPQRDKEEWDGVLVSMEGEVVGMDRRDTATRITLGQGGNFITAEVETRVGTQPFEHPQIGAWVRVTGIARITYRFNIPTGERQETFGASLSMRTPADLTVLRAAPWWTPQRINLALGAFAVAIVAAGLWIFALRRIVAHQAARLEEALRAHRDSELEYEATKQERIRLAHDLHDGFQQMLAGALYRLNAALNYLPTAPHDAGEQLENARSALQHTQRGLRSALWGLSEEAGGPPDFVGLLQQAVHRMDHWQGIVKVHSIGKERIMPRYLMGSLLMIVQEASGNAIRHGRATHVGVEVRFDDEGLTLAIRDNGCGFDPAATPETGNGHMGIRGMKDRARWLGGRLTITSHPDTGTEVVTHISWEKVKALGQCAERGIATPLPEA